MTNPARRRLLAAAALLAAVVTAGLILAATGRGGVIITRDSTSYLAAARSLAEGRGLLRFEGGPFTQWPPLYPLVLAGLGATADRSGVPPLDAIRLFNALTTAATVFAAGLLLRRLVAHPALVIVGLLALTFSLALLTISVHAWSEPLFALLIVVWLLWLPRVLDRPTWGRTTLLAVLTALACLQRYPGLMLVAAGGLCLLRFAAAPLRVRVGHAAAFTLLSGLPLALWLTRNLLLSGTLIRPAAEAARPTTASLEAAAASLEAAAATLVAWFVPQNTGAQALVAAGVVLLVGAFVLSRRRTAVPSLSGRFFPAAILVAFYVVFLLIATLRPEYGPIDGRFLAPVYAPLIVLILAAVDDAARRLDGRRTPYALAALAALVLVIQPASRTLAEVQTLGAWCCSRPRAADNALIDWVRANPDARPLVSNTPLPLYHTARSVTETPLTLDDWPPLDDGLYLLWFDDALDDVCIPSSFCFRADYTPDDLAQRYRLDTLLSGDDGAVYRLSAR